MKPKVSVIIPAYNQENLIERAITSVPTRDDVELIIVINGENQEIREIVSRYDVKVIDVPQPVGCWGAMNLGLEQAMGDYIYQLDEDDYLNTELFNRVIDKYLGPDLVYVNLQINDGTIWHINEANKGGITDHTSLIKRSFIGNDRFDDDGDPKKIDGGYWLMQRLIARDHTRVFTDIPVYYYNYPRETSLYYLFTHKGENK